MAINRFSQRKIYNTFNPLSIEELALLPGAKQQQHDQSLAAAQQQKLAIMAQAKDKDAATDLMNQMDSDIGDFTNNLMSRGVGPGTVRNFMDLKGKRDALLGPNGDATRIQNNYNAAQAYQKNLDEQRELWQSSGGEKGISSEDYNKAMQLSNQRYKGYKEGSFVGYQPTGTVNKTAIAQEYAQKLDKNVFEREGWEYDETMGSWRKDGFRTETPPPGYVAAIQAAVLADPRVQSKMQEEFTFLTELEGNMPQDSESGSYIVDGQYFNPNNKADAAQYKINSDINKAIFPAIGIAESGTKDIRTMDFPGTGSGGGSDSYNKNGLQVVKDPAGTNQLYAALDLEGIKGQIETWESEGETAKASAGKDYIRDARSKFDKTDGLKLVNKLPDLDKDTRTAFDGMQHAINENSETSTNGLLEWAVSKLGGSGSEDIPAMLKQKGYTDDQIGQYHEHLKKYGDAEREYQDKFNKYLENGEFIEGDAYKIRTKDEGARKQLSEHIKNSVDRAAGYSIPGLSEDKQVDMFDKIKHSDKINFESVISRGEHGLPSLMISFIDPTSDNKKIIRTEIALSEVASRGLSNSTEDLIDYIFDPRQSPDINKQIKNEIRFNTTTIGDGKNLIGTSPMYDGLRGKMESVEVHRNENGSFEIVATAKDGTVETIKDYPTKESALQDLEDESIKGITARDQGIIQTATEASKKKK